MRGLKSKEKQNTSRKEHQYGHKRKWSVFGKRADPSQGESRQRVADKDISRGRRQAANLHTRTIDHLGLQTEMVRLDSDFAVVKAVPWRAKGQVHRHGNSQQAKEMQSWQTRWLNWLKREPSLGRCASRDMASNTPVQKKCPTWRPQSSEKEQSGSKAACTSIP